MDNTKRFNSLTRFTFVLFIVLYLLYPVEVDADPYMQDGGAQGLVSIEAENYNVSSVAPDGHEWVMSVGTGHSGAGAMKAYPEDSVSWSTGYSVNSPRLDYVVEFTKTGTHYIWIRGVGPSGSSDSVHAGLNGMEVSTSDNIAKFLPNGQWVWSNREHYSGAIVTMDIPSVGVHTVNLWMRESGMKVDKLVMTVDGGYVPSGFGPAESPRGLTVAQPTITPDGGAYIDSVLVTLVTTTAGASIYYTLDGSEPTGSSQLYVAPINLTSSATVKAIGILNGYTDSAVASADFTLVPAGSNQAPVLDPVGDKAIEEGLVLSFMVTTSDADGTVPFLSVSNLPAGATFIDNGDGTGSFDWVTQIGDVGGSPYLVTFTATDELDPGLTSSEAISIDVNALSTDPFLQDGGAQGLVSIEAESYHGSIVAPDGHEWILSVGTGHSGAGAMKALPEDSVTWATGYSVNSPRLDYVVEFTKTGTHYIWIRGVGPSGSSDSVHAGLNGMEVSTSDNIAKFLPNGQWVWSNREHYSGAIVTMDIPSVGVHTVNLWMRESGMKVDKLVMTVDGGYVPSGFGPAESPRGLTVAKPTITPAGGAYTDSVLVTLDTATAGADIYYTLDGSEPTGSSQLYVAPINLTSSVTVKAIGILNGYNDSAVASADFTVVPAGSNQAPVLDPVGDKAIEEGHVLSFMVTSSDADGTVPILSASNLPAGATFIDNGDGTGSFDWVSQIGDAAGSPYMVTFTATDELDPGLTSSEIISIDVSALSADPFLQDGGIQGLVSIEAESYHGSIVAPDGHEWILSVGTGHSGAGAMEAYPEDSVTWSTGYSVNSPRLDYLVEFTKTGTHYIWIRGLGPISSSDSLHMGLDGMEVATADKISKFTPNGQWVWSNEEHGSGLVVTIDVASAGLHTVNIWMRESGMKVDKLVMTVDGGYVPSGFGPAESPRGLNVAKPTITPDGGAYIDSVLVGLDTATTGASIYYTLDGSEPTGSSQLYVAPINLTSSATVKAIGILNGYTDSAVASADFTLVPAGSNQAPVLDPVGDKAIEEGHVLSFVVTASDADGTVPFLSASNLPVGATFTDNADGTGSFDWVTQIGDAAGSPYLVTFTATDELDPGLTSSEAISIDVSALSADPFLQDGGIQGLVSIEAESYHGSIVAPDGHEWVFTTEAGNSGAGAMKAYPEDSVTWSTGYSVNSPRLDYMVEFSKIGTHYLWVRGLGPSTSSDSLHAGLNGAEVATADKISRFLPIRQWVWSNRDKGGVVVTIDVPSVGVHTVNVWMRESGMNVDKIVMTVDSGYVPSGFGPAESPRGLNVAKPTITPDGGAYIDSVLVGLDTATAEASIYYTLDGSEPTGSSQLYVAPINLTSSATVKAIGILNGYTDSAVASADFTLVPAGSNQAPVLDPVGDKAIEEGHVLSFVVTASDADGTVPFLSASNLPVGATFTDNADGTGSFDWVTQVGDAAGSPYMVTFTATDELDPGLTSSEIISIDISDDPFIQYGGALGLVSIEAENYHGSIVAPDGHEWVFTTEAGNSGAGAMEAYPEDETSWGSVAAVANSPRLDYQVDFVKTGIHYIWVRGLGPSTSSDSLHIGLDGMEVATAANIARFLPTGMWVWSNEEHYNGLLVTMDIPSAGVHTVNVWMRESGMKVDKIVMTVDAGYVPNGFGPAESPRGWGSEYDPYVSIMYPVSYHIQTSQDLYVEVESGNLQPTWGIRFVLDIGTAGEQIIYNYTYPYIVTFSGLSRDVHTIDVFIVDTYGTEIETYYSHDQIIDINIGYYYVAVGNSITRGNGDNTSSDNESADGRNIGGGYEPILNDLLTGYNGLAHTVENEGIGGETSSGGVGLIQSFLDSHPESGHFLIMFGTNDSKNLGTPSGLGLTSGDPDYMGSYKNNMQDIINAVVSEGKIPVLSKVPITYGDCGSCSPWPDPFTEPRNLLIQEYNAVIDELETENGLTISGPDLYTWSVNNPEEFSDNLHPNGTGYQSIANEWFLELRDFE